MPQQNIRNNETLRKVREMMNTPIYQKVRTLINKGKLDEARTFFGQFFNDESRERVLNEVFGAKSLPASDVKALRAKYAKTLRSGDKRWLEVKIYEHDTSEYPFSVKVRDDQGWSVSGEFKTRRAAERAMKVEENRTVS